MSCNIHTLSWLLLMTGGKMRRWCHQTTFCFLYHLKQHVHVPLDLESNRSQMKPKYGKSIIDILGCSLYAMFLFLSHYHIITSSGIGNVESICQLTLSLLFSPLCAFDFGHIILPCIECFELFFLLLLIFFLQTSDVARYLLFTDRKKYPVKRGGTYLRCSTFVSKCEYENVNMKILINVDNLQDFQTTCRSFTSSSKI